MYLEKFVKLLIDPRTLTLPFVIGISINDRSVVLRTIYTKKTDNFTL